MRYASACLLVASALASASVARADDRLTISEALLQHEAILPRAASIPTTRRLLVVTEIRAEGPGMEMNTELLVRVVRQKLSAAGVRFKFYERDFAADFAGRRVSTDALLAPKLVVEVLVQRDALGYSLSCSVSLLEYHRVPHTEGHFVARRAWQHGRDSRGIPKAELEDTVVQYLQSELGTFLRERPKAGEVHHVRQSAHGERGNESAAKFGGDGNSAALSYQLNWNDPDNRRNRFYFGATVGTPALLNLNVGFWGSRSFPIVVGVSGMYFSTERRGLQGDIGWAFDNAGALKQAISVALGLFNGGEQVTTYQRDQFDRITKTSVDTVNALHPYLGPAYTLDWKDIRFQAGAAARIDSSSQPEFRFLISVGYTPRL